MNSPDQIECQVLESLRIVAVDWSKSYPSDEECTRAVKDAIGIVGEKLGYRIYASRCRFEANGEWLFDMTWLDLRGEDLVGVPLALESEWSPREIWDDFEKLLVARADHRVFVYWQPSLSRARTLAEELLEAARSFRSSRPGDRYLFACWVDEVERFEVRLSVLE